MLPLDILKVLAIALLFSATQSLSAQNKIKYSYDAAGNLVKREVLIEPQKAPENQQRAPEGGTATSFDGKHKADIHLDKGGDCIVASISGLTTGDKCFIEMFSTQGALVMRYNGSNGDTALDIGWMQTGVYLLKIEINGKFRTWKVTNR